MMEEMIVADDRLLRIRDETLGHEGISRVYENVPCCVSPPFGRFMDQQVAFTRLLPQDFPRSGDLETLRHPAVIFQLHAVPPKQVRNPITALQRRSTDACSPTKSDGKMENGGLSLGDWDWNGR
jgi:hypothetical protein